MADNFEVIMEYEIKVFKRNSNEKCKITCCKNTSQWVLIKCLESKQVEIHHACAHCVVSVFALIK